MKNSFYHKMGVIDMLAGNYWVIVAVVFIAVAIIVAVNQYNIRDNRLVKHYGDALYFILSAAATLTITVLLIIESHAGIVQLLDNCLRGNESPLLSVILMPFVAMTLGIAFGVVIAIIGDIAASLHKRSLAKKLRFATKACHKTNRHRIRRGQPTGNPRPGATRPTHYDATRDTANHRPANRVSAGQGMRQR